MNIHITDKALFERLLSASITRIQVGSVMYGTNDEFSDIDYLYIYATSENELASFVQTNHQLQYKEDGIDHNFVSLHTFIRNILNGDSTINYEILRSGSLSDTDLDWLNKLADVFDTYTIARSYNGLAKRDVKHYGKTTSFRERVKQFEHIVRGYTYCELIMSDAIRYDGFKRVNDVLKTELGKLLSEQYIRDESPLGRSTFLKHVERYSNMLDVQRKTLNDNLDNKSLPVPKTINGLTGKILELSLRKFLRTDVFKIRQSVLKDFDTQLFIDTLENGVTYA